MFVSTCVQVLTEHSYLLDDAGEELYDHLIQLVVFERYCLRFAR